MTSFRGAANGGGRGGVQRVRLHYGPRQPEATGDGERDDERRDDAQVRWARTAAWSESLTFFFAFISLRVCLCTRLVWSFVAYNGAQLSGFPPPGSGRLEGTVRTTNDGCSLLYYDLVYHGPGPFTLTCVPITADTHVSESGPIQVPAPCSAVAFGGF